MTKAAPFSFVAPTVYGQMILSRYDINQTEALLRTGKALDHDEINLLRTVLKFFDGPHVFIDIGANFGVYSLGFADAVGPGGKVHAFEPQRIIYNMMAGTMALNGISNVYCHNVALGDREGRVEIPQYDYNQILNFGSIEFSGRQNETLSQPRGNDPAMAEYVRLATLDSFGFEGVHIIKIDVEGMELQVLDGAAATIQKNRPVLFVEWLKSDKAALQEKIAGYGYELYEDGINFLCIPHERSSQIRINRSTSPPRAS